MKNLICVVIIGIVCLAGCTLSGVNLTVKDPSVTPAEAPINAPTNLRIEPNTE